MSELSIKSLFIAVAAVLNEREGLLQRLEAVPPEVDEEERLSERVMDIEQALEELADAYEARRAEAPSYPDFATLAGSVGSG